MAATADLIGLRATQVNATEKQIQRASWIFSKALRVVGMLATVVVVWLVICVARRAHQDRTWISCFDLVRAA